MLPVQLIKPIRTSMSVMYKAMTVRSHDGFITMFRIFSLQSADLIITFLFFSTSDKIGHVVLTFIDNSKFEGVSSVRHKEFNASYICAIKYDGQ